MPVNPDVRGDAIEVTGGKIIVEMGGNFLLIV